MGRQDFDAFLQKRAEEAQQEPPVNWDEVKDEWLKQIDIFFTFVRKWLREYIKSGKVVIEERDLTLNEERLGVYSTKALHIHFANHEVVVAPVARRVLGAHGRIDMESAIGKVTFLLVDTNVTGLRPDQRIFDDTRKTRNGKAAEPTSPTLTWKISTPPPNINFIAVTEDVFFDALMEVINA